MSRKVAPRLLALLVAEITAGSWTMRGPEGLRLYVMDCGQLNRGEPTRYELTNAEVEDSNFSDPCYLVVHPRGTLLWDLGIIPDDEIEAGLTVQPPEGGVGSNQSFRTLTSQLEEIGYAPDDITHVAFSHAHADHIANANDYADGAVWMVQMDGWVDMFSDQGRQRREFARYADLESAETVILNGDHDVFGDGLVQIIATPGHAAGHQSLLVRLGTEGPLMLSGDLFHYPAERILGRMPTAERERGTPESRDKVERLLLESGGRLWIQHDIVHYAELRKSPEFYD